MLRSERLRTESQPRRFLVAQLGARRHYAVPVILHEAGLLETFCTDFCANGGLLHLVRSVVPAGLRPQSLKRLLDRRVELIPTSKIRCFPGFALHRGLRKRCMDTRGKRNRFHREANERFGRLVAQQGLGSANAVYCFNGAALEIFACAKTRAVTTVLDQTSTPESVFGAIMREEQERWPGWESDRIQPRDWGPMAQREQTEWELADAILCGSEWVKQTVGSANGPTERCQVVPYGINPKAMRGRIRRPVGAKLRVLFVGTVSLGKGIQYLLQAARELKAEDCVFRAVGHVAVTDLVVKELRSSVELIGHVPRSAMARQYDWGDVLVLPSIAEGSAGVCYEALAAGLPVITTKNAGSVVRDGREGYIVPMRDPARLASRIAELVSDRGLLEELSRGALARAEQFTWDSYSKRLIQAIPGLQLPDPRVTNSEPI